MISTEALNLFFKLQWVRYNVSRKELKKKKKYVDTREVTQTPGVKEPLVKFHLAVLPFFLLLQTQG